MTAINKIHVFVHVRYKGLWVLFVLFLVFLCFLVHCQVRVNSRVISRVW